MIAGISRKWHGACEAVIEGFAQIRPDVLKALYSDTAKNKINHVERLAGGEGGQIIRHFWVGIICYELQGNEHSTAVLK